MSNIDEIRSELIASLMENVLNGRYVDTKHSLLSCPANAYLVALAEEGLGVNDAKEVELCNCSVKFALNSLEKARNDGLTSWGTPPPSERIA